MSGTRASQGSDDALDEALAAALAQALCANPEGGLKLTKRARLKRHRDAIVALRAKRWSWEQIATMMAGAGLSISPRTLRIQMTAPKKSARKRVFREGRADPMIGAGPHSTAKTKRSTSEAAATALAAHIGTTGQRDGRPPDQRPTESGFFTIDMENN